MSRPEVEGGLLGRTGALQPGPAKAHVPDLVAVNALQHLGADFVACLPEGSGPEPRMVEIGLLDAQAAAGEEGLEVR